MYCSTEEMIAAFFTKPLQEAQFVKFRGAVLGIDAKNDDECLARYWAVLKSLVLLLKKKMLMHDYFILLQGPQECAGHINIWQK